MIIFFIILGFYLFIGFVINIVCLPDSASWKSLFGLKFLWLPAIFIKKLRYWITK
jgi:hypothetical protein